MVVLGGWAFLMSEVSLYTSHGTWVPCATMDANAPVASERRGNTLKGFKDFYLKAEARIWP